MEYNGTYYGDAYCVKCKEKRELEGKIRVSDSGRRMVSGNCDTCGTKMNRILGAQPFEEKPIKVPEPPKREPYARITMYLDGKLDWIAEAIDYRRVGYPGETSVKFRSIFKTRALRKAQEWVDSYEKVELYK